MTTLEILRAARLHLVRGWTQNALARDALGWRCPPTDARAASWDVIGSVRAVGDGPNEAQAIAELRASAELVGSEALSAWADAPARTQAEVIAVFDRAIARLEVAAAGAGS